LRTPSETAKRAEDEHTPAAAQRNLRIAMLAGMKRLGSGRSANDPAKHESCATLCLTFGNGTRFEMPRALWRIHLGATQQVFLWLRMDRLRLHAPLSRPTQYRINDYLSERMQLLGAISHDSKKPITRMRLRADLMDDVPLRRFWRTRDCWDSSARNWGVPVLTR
jgi:hypothetical protein